MKAFILSCLSILRFGLVFAIILFGQQTRGFLVGVISGHISVTALDGTYLGISLINLLGHLPMLGLTSAIDVMGIRALANTATQKQTGVIVQRTLLICLLLSLPIISVLLLLRPVLLYIHQDPGVLDAASSLLHMSLAVVPINAVSLCMAKYLFILNRQRAVVYSVVVTIGAALMMLTIVTFSLEASLPTLHWCYVVCELLQPLLLGAYFYYKRVHDASWDGFSLKALTEWSGILISALPSSGIIVIEWGMYEIFLLIAGSRDPSVVRGNAIGLTVVSIGYLLQYGIGVSATTHISQAIASGNTDGAKKYIKSSLLASLISAVLFSAGTLGCKYILSSVFSPSPQLDNITPWITCYVFLDAYQIVMNAILRGCSQYIIPLIITVSSFTVSLVAGSVMMLLRPSALVATPSVWLALCIGGLLCGVGLTVMLNFTKMEGPPGEAAASAMYSVQSEMDLVELVTQGDEEQGADSDDLRLIPVVIGTSGVQHLVLTKGGLFLLGIISVTTAAIVNISQP